MDERIVGVVRYLPTLGSSTAYRVYLDEQDADAIVP